jgi:hypothetical protein
MNRNLPLILILLLLATGCVTTIVPTAVPPSPNLTVAPQNQTTSVPQSPAQGQCQSKLLGRVVDANGALAKGAVIAIKSGSFTAKTLSDDNGLYGFAGLCAGTYGFTVTLPSKPPKTLTTSATLDGGNTARTDLAVK